MSTSTHRNAVSWFEIPVTDMDRAVRFWETTLAAPLQREVFGGAPHAVFPREGEGAVTGALVHEPSRLRPSSTSGVLVYLDARGDLDGALARAAQSGGEIAQPRTAIGPHGFIAAVVDTEGNLVALHSMK